MSHMSNEAIQAQIEALARDIRVGETVKTAAGATGTASKPIYADSSSLLAVGDLPFQTTMAGMKVSGLADTTVSALEVVGLSNPIGYLDTLMTGQLVLGSNVTTFTKTGFIRVKITDSEGNLTDGDHYIQIGTLS